MYAEEHEARCRLETENKELIENHANEEQSVENVKAIRTENKSLKEKLENRSLELKHLKADLENVNKEKNVLSVALKTSKAEIKDQRKGFEKKSSELEKKVVELNDFKKKKLAEERELKIKNRKEIKKANQKIKKEKVKESSAEENIIENDHDLKLVENPKLEIKVPSECEKDILEEVAEKKVEEATEDFAKSVESETDPNGNLDREASTENNAGTEDAVIDENAEGFIRPKLPPRMTKEEIAAFYKEMMAKFKLDG